MLCSTDLSWKRVPNLTNSPHDYPSPRNTLCRHHCSQGGASARPMVRSFPRSRKVRRLGLGRRCPHRPSARSRCRRHTGPSCHRRLPRTGPRGPPPSHVGNRQDGSHVTQLEGTKVAPGRSDPQWATPAGCRQGSVNRLSGRGIGKAKGLSRSDCRPWVLRPCWISRRVGVCCRTVRARHAAASVASASFYISAGMRKLRRPGGGCVA